MAYNMFLKVEDVEGDSTDANHDKWIEVVSLSHGISQEARLRPIAVEARERSLLRGRIDFRDFSVTKRVDKASIPLVSKLLNVDVIPEVTLEICRATGDKTTFMKVVLKHAFVASIALTGSASAEDPLPMEQVTFRYGQIEWTYTTTSPSGQPGDTFEAMYDIEQGD